MNAAELFAEHEDGSPMRFGRLHHGTAAAVVSARHYLKRSPSISHAFGLWLGGNLRGVITFGFPASHHLMVSACPESPGSVLELNRLWCDDELPRNTESAFIARALAELPPSVVVSYADTSEGHVGYVYRAANFRYAGWTDMDRKTPRFDYVVPGKHSRDAMRCGTFTRVRRLPKVKYWTVAGPTKRDRKRMLRMAAWPSMSWKDTPPPCEGVTVQEDGE
ncbi:MAG: hypothetical protein WAW13_00685 [Minisyncoccia bacterium]